MNEIPDKPTRRERAKKRILQSTAVLPSFVTLLNGLAGMGAIHFATKEALGTLSPLHMHNLMIAAWLIFLAMIFDMLDGRLARMTRRTSDFGAQLDSLCDVISFGVAPAVLMVRMVIPALRQLGELGHDWRLDRVAWSISAIYVACAVMRLARFNVETEEDESAHMDFRGLPTPGAAAAVASLVLLFERLSLPRFFNVWNAQGQWQGSLWQLMAISSTLILITLATAMLMVSQCKYAHLVNHYIRGKKPFSYLVKLVVIGLAMLWQPFATLAIATNAYALSGPAGAVWRRIKSKKAICNDDEE